MAIEYKDNLETLTAEALTGFFAGWPEHPDEATHLEILKKSAKVWLAMEGPKCVGFINALTDGVFYAYVPLLEVLPGYHGQGIGSELVQRMTQSLSGMYAVDAVCDEAVAPFYSKLGFGKCAGMVKRNFKRQNPAK